MDIVIVEGCRDFDAVFVDSVWVNDTKTFFHKKDFVNDETPDNIIYALKQCGYRNIKPQQIIYGTNF